MRAIYLIARREYISYVATWGFWLSLMSVPVFMVLGAAIPALVQSSQPMRYYVMIDETGGNLDDVVQAGLERERRTQIRAALEAMAPMAGPERRDRALEAFDEDPSGLSRLPEALEILGMEEGAGAFTAQFGRHQRVGAPGRTLAELRPYLSGDATVQTSEGPRPLFAAVFIAPGEGAGTPPRVVYYSTNVTDTALASASRRALGEHLRQQALMGRGLSAQEIAALSAIEPELRNLNPLAEDGEAEVTMADRAPFFISLFLAFILWTAVFSVANMLLTSLIEEKGGKIIELLLSTARFHEILIGKLAGVAAVSFTLFLVWGLVGAAASFVTAQFAAALDPDLAQLIAALVDPGLLLAALGYFIVGYLMFGAIFLALGSLCETLQEAQTLMTPIILVLMAPLMILAFALQAMDSAVVQAASWIPLWTPFIMMARLPTEPPLWELLGTTALMLATMAAVVWAAAAVFRQGALGQADADSVKRMFSRKKG
jgi:ABC-2 type transport system permease protein